MVGADRSARGPVVIEVHGCGRVRGTHHRAQSCRLSGVEGNRNLEECGIADARCEGELTK